MDAGKPLARAGTLRELDERGGRLAVTASGREALVVRSSTGELFAIDRLCPHEGYPLDDAEVRGERLTCPWHGWCFDLRSGACLTAGEDTRSYRVEVVGDDVLVGLAVEPSDAERGRLAETLLSAVEAGQAERAARLVVRLLHAGADPAHVAAPLARYAATHGERLGRGAGALADAVALARREPAAAVAVLAEAAAVLAELDGRRPPRLPAEGASPFAYGGPTRAGAALADAVGCRDADAAEAIVVGVLDRGTAPEEVARWLGSAVSARFRGPLPLALVERASVLAGLDATLPRAILGAAARTAALAPPLDGVPPYRGRALDPDADAEAAATSLGASLAAFDLAVEAAGSGSLLDVADGLAYAHAAARLRAGAAHAAWLATDAAAFRGAPPPAAPPASGLAARAASAAASATGSAACLAAVRAALELGGDQELLGASRLISTPRLERTIPREVAGERRRLRGRAAID